MICVTDGLANELISKTGWEKLRDSDEDAKIVFLHTTFSGNMSRDSVEQKSLQDYMKYVTRGLYFPIDQDVLINGTLAENRSANSNKVDGVCGTINDMLLHCVEKCQQGVVVNRQKAANIFTHLQPEVFKNLDSGIKPNAPLFPLDDVVDIDLVSALNSGSGMRPEMMFKVSPVTLMMLEDEEAESTSQQLAFNGLADEEIRYTEIFLRTISSFSCANDAQRIWAEASTKLRSNIADLVSAFEDCVFPFNRYTRRKADFKGSQLHLQGLIKAVITDFNYKKFYSTRTAGGKREYVTCILVDISQSMDGNLISSALESLVMIVEALVEMKLDEFAVVLFGSNVQLIKEASQEWSKEHMLSLLAPNRLNCTGHTSTQDGAAIKLGTYLLQKYSSKTKKMFVLSDGFTSNGKDTMLSIKRARDAGIDVVGVGVGMCKTNVQDLYSNWITAALPKALPGAFRELFSPDRESVSPVATAQNKETETWRRAALLKSSSVESVASILQDSSERFDKLQSLLKDVRELSLVRGNSPAAIIVDLVFLVDCTGSMKPMLGKIKSDILSIAVGGGTAETMSIIERVQEKFPGNKIQMRCGLVEFRDTGSNDAVPLRVHKGRDVLFDSAGNSLPSGKNLFVKLLLLSHDCLEISISQFTIFSGVESNFFNVTYDPDTRLESVTGQRGSFSAAVNSLQAYGGGDLAEDLPAPLIQIGSWLDWKGQARFALLFTDAPPHGSEFHTSDFQAKGRTGDAAAERSSNTVTNFEMAFNSLISKNVKTFLCTCNKHATDIMLGKLKGIVVKTATTVERAKAAAEGRLDQPRAAQDMVDDYLKVNSDLAKFEILR